MQQKQEIIIQYFREGKSYRQIVKLTGFHRNTVKKYITCYQNARQELLSSKAVSRIDKIELIANLIEPPVYHTVNREKRILTEEMIKKIQSYLEENEHKKNIGQRKQCKKIIDIHTALLDEGFVIGYTTVRNIVAKLLKKSQEAFIKIYYPPGQICEFDWGDVKIFINGKLQKFQMAVFTSAYSNYRFAVLFAKQKTECFVESHALFFEHLGGTYQTMVYDNMKVAVKKFVGRYEKEPTDALLKLSTYYGFNFRFCNIQAGNEKGHVERSVEYVRRKAFCSKDYFSDLTEANEHLLDICQKLNQKIQTGYKQTGNERLLQERHCLLPAMPIYESARVEWLRVDKYSTIIVDQCHYSVPDSFVGQLLFTKIYSTQIRCFYNDALVAEHNRLQGCQEWAIKIDHYFQTLNKKPNALSHSVALKQADPKLQNMYKAYFHKNEKTFVEVLFLCQKHGIEVVENAVETLLDLTPTDISSDKIRVLCERSSIPLLINDYNEFSIIAISKEQLASYSILLPSSDEAFSCKGATA